MRNIVTKAFTQDVSWVQNQGEFGNEKAISEKIQKHFLISRKQKTFRNNFFVLSETQGT